VHFETATGKQDNTGRYRLKQQPLEQDSDSSANKTKTEKWNCIKQKASVQQKKQSLE
jgi:hypothetical protein